MAIKKTKKKPVVKKVVKTAKRPVAKAAAKKVNKSAAKSARPVQPKKITLNVKKPLTKSQTVEQISLSTGVKKRDVSNVLEAIAGLMEAHLSKKGPGEMNFAGLLKCRVVNKPATKARQGINPFTGQPMTFSAKPARSVIKIRPLKKLKEIVG